MTKKAVITTLAVILIFAMLLGGLYLQRSSREKQQGTADAGQTAVIVSHDKTVYPSFVYNFDSISSETLIGEKHYSFKSLEQDDLKMLADSASDIIRGRIVNTSYTFIDGHAWTLAEIQVLSSFKGELVKDDVISVFYPGGYVSAHDYNSVYDRKTPGSENEFYQVIADGSPSPFLLEEELFFLSSDVAGLSLPSGGYVLSSGNSSVVTTNDDGSKFYWQGETLTADRLLEIIE